MPAEQRTALVTGGSGGLGEAIARALHDAGHTVLIVHSPGNASIGAWLKTQAGEGYDFAAYGADVADHARCQELADRIHTDGHRIDILVNNAGITRDATFRKLSYTDWDAVLRVNLDSVFNVTRPFIDGMLDRGWGRIINISSINGSKGQFGQTNYSAAKAGMHGFTKALVQDRIPIGVAQLAERSIARDARVVDQNVDVVTVCLNEAGQLLAGGMVGHIRAVGDEVVTFACLGFQPRANVGVAWRVDDEHGMANIVQGSGDGLAQATAAAGDQRSPLFSLHCVLLYWLARPCAVQRPTPPPTV